MADSDEEEDTNVDIERNWFLITQVPGTTHSHRRRGHGHRGTYSCKTLRTNERSGKKIVKPIRASFSTLNIFITVCNRTPRTFTTQLTNTEARVAASQLCTADLNSADWALVMYNRTLYTVHGNCAMHVHLQILLRENRKYQIYSEIEENITKTLETCLPLSSNLRVLKLM